jgi:hypothetical protein
VLCFSNMDHVAIMNKSWHLIPKIVSGEKIIESRWYQTRRAPWNVISNGDIVYFKNSGELVTASAKVSKVLQFTLQSEKDAEEIVKKYGKDICIVNPDPKTWGKLPKYCILIFLKNAQYLDQPFQINKTGFGNSTAWLLVNDIKKIKI